MTYKQIIRDSKQLAVLIPKGKYKAIHGIPAGGIVTAIVMAEKLKINNILSVDQYKKYENKKEVLVVDDLIDTGKTLQRYQSDCAVIYKKPHSPKPTYWLKNINSKWVTFPHEKDKDGILDHIVRIFSFIDIRLDEQHEQVIINLLNKIKKL